MSTMDYLEFKNYLEHASKAGMPTNLPKPKTKNGRGGMPSNVRNNAINKALQAVSSARSTLSSHTEKENNLHDSYISATFAKTKKPWKDADMNELGPKTSNAGTTELSKIRSANNRKLESSMSNARSALNSLLTSGVLTDSEKNSIRNILAANDKAVTSDTLSTYYLPDLEATLRSILKHDNLEHGWFTDLFKKKPTYTSTGSTAGMPTNLPRTATSGGSAGSKQLVYSDRLRKLNSNLVEYELKMNQAKASYDEYRKLYNDTKKKIANTEKALTEATKEAARTGFDPSKSSVAAPARRYASSNAILPQTTITGSTEGLKNTRYHVKKKK